MNHFRRPVRSHVCCCRPVSVEIATAVALFITTALWLAGKLTGVAAAKLWPLRGAVLAVDRAMGFTLMCITILAVGRSQALEPVFADLTGRLASIDRRSCALLLVLLHPILLVAQAVQQKFPLAIFLVPFSSHRHAIL